MRDWLAAAFERRPYHPFLVAPEGPHTFEEVEMRVRAVVGGLAREGVGVGDRVAIWPGNDADSVVRLSAIPRTGAAAVVLNRRLTPAEARRHAGIAGVTAVVGPAADLGVREVGSKSGDLVEPTAMDPSATHSIFFTSGSAGTPRAVRLTWANLEASAAASALHLEHSAHESWLCVLPIFHVGGFMILLRSARQATTVVLEPRFDPGRVAGLIGETTLASLVAPMLGSVLDRHPSRFEGVKAVLVGGGPTPQGLLDRAAAGGLPVLPTYGMTETASQIATAALADGLRPRRRAVALPGAEIRVGGGGVIEVRGPMVSPGYVGERDRRAEDWFRTGDVGELDELGGLTVVGRADDVIITGGEKVHPTEIEVVLREHPGVDEVVVVGVPDRRWGEVVTAVYEGAATVADLDRKARYRLAGFKVPKHWMQVDELPRLSIGKVDRARVKEWLRRSGPAAQV